MSDQYKHYEATKIMRSPDPSTLRITDMWKFKSDRSKKWYIVEMEHFENNLVAIKFYNKAHRLSPHKYSLMTNDNEPRTIVYSCLELMKRYYLEDNTISFGFVAAPDLDVSKTKKIPNRRFNFYRRVVSNYFGTTTFEHVYDKGGQIYLLLNKSMIDSGNLRAQDVVDNINNIYGREYSLSTKQ